MVLLRISSLCEAVNAVKYWHLPMQAADKLIHGARSQPPSAAMCEACKRLQQAAHHFERLDGGAAAVNEWRTHCKCGAQGLCDVKRQVGCPLHRPCMCLRLSCLLSRVHHHDVQAWHNCIMHTHIVLIPIVPMHLPQSRAEHCLLRELSSVRHQVGCISTVGLSEGV